MRLRNNIFAEAFKWLKKNWEGIKYQKDLAAKIGVSEDTITRIMRDQTEVTDDFLCKFNEAFDNVFNYQWLRGEDTYHMLTADLVKEQEEKSDPSEQIDQQHLFNTALSAKEETIKSLRAQLADKDRIIKLLEQKIEVLEAMQHIDTSDTLGNYQFTIGSAEDANIERNYKI